MPTALHDNLLAVQDEQVFDVPGRPESPYQPAGLFATPCYPVTHTPAYRLGQPGYRLKISIVNYKIML